MREDLRVFATAAKCRSLSQAARQLALPSSSVSRKISALERRLGAALFVRTTRYLDLTEAGRIYLASVQRALAELQQGENTVAELDQEVRGTLVVDARVLLGTRLITPILPELRRRHPLLRIDLRLNHGLNPELAAGADVGVRYEIGPDSDLISRKFALSRRVLVASPSYLAHRGEPKHPQELNAHECIGYAPEGKTVAWRFRGNGYEGFFTPEGRLVSNDGFGIFAAAVAGLGLCVAHEWMVAEELRSGQLRHVLTEFEVSTAASFETPLYLVYNAHLRETSKLRAFVDCMLDRYRNSLIAAC